MLASHENNNRNMNDAIPVPADIVTDQKWILVLYYQITYLLHNQLSLVIVAL